MTANLNCPACGGSNDDNSFFCIHCGNQLGRGTGDQDAAFMAPGTTVREYRVDRLLGEGGMGQVYVAVHCMTGERVAIKRMLPGLSNDPATLRRFLEEARTMTLLKHPSIVQLKQFFEMQGRFFLVMDFVDGKSAEELVAERRAAAKWMTVTEVLGIIGPIAEALHYIHNLRTTQTVAQEDGTTVTRQIEGVVHRDIKPANILVDDSGKPYLMDFGIAKPEGRERLTRIGGVVGTYEFMAPEQIRAEGVGPHTDQYALAVTLFYLLTGAPPFPQKTEAGFDAMEGHLRGELPPLSIVRRGIPPGVEMALGKAMAKNSADRFSNCHEFGRALVEAVDGGEGPEIASRRDATVRLPDADVPGGETEIVSSGKPLALIGGGIIALCAVVLLALWGAGVFKRKDQGSAGNSSKTAVWESSMGAKPAPSSADESSGSPAVLSPQVDGPSPEREAAAALRERKERQAEAERQAQVERVEKERQAETERQAEAERQAAEIERKAKEQAAEIERRQAEIDRIEKERQAELERRKTNWYCLCYQERVKGTPTLSTACRSDWSACDKLATTIDSGRSPFVKGSISRSCTHVRAEHPWDVLGSAYAWKPSKKSGSWWSDRGCFIP